jgi:hypothetical protein
MDAQQEEIVRWLEKGLTRTKGYCDAWKSYRRSYHSALRTLVGCGPSATNYWQLSIAWLT